MTRNFERLLCVLAGMLLAGSAIADGAADAVTGSFRHAGPANDPGDVIYSKVISAHEAFADRPQRGFIYAVRPDGYTWEYIDLSDEDACVNVYEEGKARIGGVISDGIGPALGAWFGWALEDRGEPGRLTDLSTTLRFADAAGLQAWCASGDIGYALHVYPHIVVAGNLQVHDYEADGD